MTLDDFLFFVLMGVLLIFIGKSAFKSIRKLVKGEPVNGCIVINGTSYSGSNISISGGRVFIDDLEISSNLNTGGANSFVLKIEGDVNIVNVDNGSVTCGNVTKTVRAGSSVKCGSVGGSVNAGSSVQCGDVDGNVSAGSSVQCKTVGGNVSAGSSVKYSG